MKYTFALLIFYGMGVCSLVIQVLKRKKANERIFSPKIRGKCLCDNGDEWTEKLWRTNKEFKEQLKLSRQFLIQLSIVFTYKFSADLWNSFIFSPWAPTQSSLWYDPSIPGSSNGLESPLKKCNSGTASSHVSASDFQCSAIIWLHSSSIPIAARLQQNEIVKDHTSDCKNFLSFKSTIHERLRRKI